MTAQLSTFFVFQSALMIQVDPYIVRSARAVALLVTLAPIRAVDAAAPRCRSWTKRAENLTEKEDNQPADSAGPDIAKVGFRRARLR